MKLSDQLTLGDVDPHYKIFVDKFKPKKTTDDCYTPEPVFNAVLDWVVKEYGIDREKIIRPFWPGCDYTEFDYPEDATVVDNPPFSIITKICRDYQTAGVKFFLFSPYLTNLNTNIGGGVPHRDGFKNHLRKRRNSEYLFSNELRSVFDEDRTGIKRRNHKSK